MKALRKIISLLLCAALLAALAGCAADDVWFLDSYEISAIEFSCSEEASSEDILIENARDARIHATDSIFIIWGSPLLVSYTCIEAPQYSICKIAQDECSKLLPLYKSFAMAGATVCIVRSCDGSDSGYRLYSVYNKRYISYFEKRECQYLYEISTHLLPTRSESVEKIGYSIANCDTPDEYSPYGEYREGETSDTELISRVIAAFDADIAAHLSENTELLHEDVSDYFASVNLGEKSVYLFSDRSIVYRKSFYYGEEEYFAVAQEIYDRDGFWTDGICQQTEYTLDEAYFNELWALLLELPLISDSTHLLQTHSEEVEEIGYSIANCDAPNEYSPYVGHHEGKTSDTELISRVIAAFDTRIASHLSENTELLHEDVSDYLAFVNLGEESVYLFSDRSIVYRNSFYYGEEYSAVAKESYDGDGFWTDGICQQTEYTLDEAYFNELWDLLRELAATAFR